MNFKRRVRFFVMIAVMALILTQGQIVFASSANDVFVEVSNVYGYWTDADTILNLPLSWDQRWLLNIINNPDLSGEHVINPKIVANSSLGFVGFYPDNPAVFTPQPDLGVYTWNYVDLDVKETEHLGESMWTTNEKIIANPRFSAERIITPETLTEPKTLQDITVNFKLEEPLPLEINSLSIIVGNVNLAYGQYRLVETRFISQDPVGGWSIWNEGTRAYWNAINPHSVEIGKTYTFHAVLEANKSPDLLGSPIAKPYVQIVYARWRNPQSIYGNSIQLNFSDSMRATYYSDNMVMWRPMMSDHRYDFGFSPIVSEITPPPAPFHVLIPADVRIEPETLNLKERGIFAIFSGLFQRQDINSKALNIKPKIPDIKSKMLSSEDKGVFTAFIKLPEEYNVNDIDITTVKAEGASAVKGIIANDTLIVKFKNQDLQDVEPGEEVEITVSGELKDGSIFKGTDVVRVID